MRRTGGPRTSDSCHSTAERAGFRVPSSFQYYTGGVFDVADCSTNIIGYHEMLIVGYTSSYWIVKNSWGTGFGNAGYVYYARGKNLCGMANELIAIHENY
jgi:C1A family cysteine protease